MFRLKLAALPPDPTYPVDLKELGYLITSDGRIRQIDEPEKGFQFRISNNDRINMVHRESFHWCIRREIDDRMAKFGITKLYLPQMTIDKPSEPHVPIYATPATLLRNRKRVIIIVNEEVQDLGIWAYRSLCGDLGMDGGTAVGIVKEMVTRSMECSKTDRPEGQCLDFRKKNFHDVSVHKREQSGTEKTLKKNAPSPGCGMAECGLRIENKTTEDFSNIPQECPPGIIVLNPGQYIYSHSCKTTMTPVTWDALPRASAGHPPRNIDPQFNTVTGHRISTDHITSIFQNIVTNPDFVHPEAEIYIVGISTSSFELLALLNKHWRYYSRIVKAIALTQPMIPNTEEIADPSFLTFLRHRCRSWILSEEPMNTPVAMPLTTSAKNKREKNSTDVISDDENDDAIILSDPQEVDSTSKKINWLEEIEHEIRTRSGLTDSTVRTDENFHYFTSQSKREGATILSNQDPILCPTLSSGSSVIHECIFPNVYRSILDFFENVAEKPNTYRNPSFQKQKCVKRDIKSTGDEKDRSQSFEAVGPLNQGESQSLRQKIAENRAHSQLGEESSVASQPETDMCETVEEMVEFAGESIPKHLLLSSGLLPCEPPVNSNGESDETLVKIETNVPEEAVEIVEAGVKDLLIEDETATAQLGADPHDGEEALKGGHHRRLSVHNALDALLGDEK